ncbi:hypothetical protein BpHYR1_039777 [Brachionus plicatilis]|uniref:Uncharacterized protein n=1 Tax=Brachionus plicatilis TaxID=10195 RepID=A0A3M7SKT5_BRAPC|nr:hypothetical protein BpHYR1_039777 [Brachionus plicatilis]
MFVRISIVSFKNIEIGSCKSETFRSEIEWRHITKKSIPFHSVLLLGMERFSSARTTILPIRMTNET